MEEEMSLNTCMGEDKQSEKVLMFQSFLGELCFNVFSLLVQGLK